MLAGPLNKRIWLQTCADTETPTGAPKETFADWVEVWAAIEPGAPREYWAAQGVNADITHTVRIRMREGLNATMRVRWTHGPGSPQQTDLFDVLGPPIEVKTNRTEVWLMCRQSDTRGFRTGQP